MRKLFAATAVMLSVMLVATTSHAETQTYSGKYTGGIAGAGLYYPLGDPDLGDFGGAAFVGTEGVPTSIEVLDASGGDVIWTVAQDLNGNTIAGEAAANEPTISGCGKGGSLAGSAFPFQEGFAITVFVRNAARVDRNTVPPGVFPCAAVVTQGTITLTTEL